MNKATERALKILLIDDDPFALTLLTRQLAHLGYPNVVSSESAQNALEQLQNGLDIDVVLCDLQMPGMDGIEFVRELVQTRYRGAVALISGEDPRILQSAERLAKAHQLDVLGTLSKPPSNQSLLHLLSQQDQHLDNTRPAAPNTYTPRQLQRAIDQGQLVNHYQPKVDLASGALVGVETLVRWQHPDEGLIYPDQFIGTAEDHGMMHDLTRTVLIEALRQRAAWRADKLTIHVAVNVSMANLNKLDFPDMVQLEAQAAQVPLEDLVLEVTESRLMLDPLAVLDIVTRLRLRRVGLAIDDFGTGHSSLAQLRDIPFTELKIDRSFVHGASQSSSLRAILEANLNLAHQLGMKTVAEGVENIDDWHLLRAIDCDVAQGYLIGKPMPATDLPNWLTEWEGRRTELTAQ